jgi:hypothetical protein
MDLNSFNLIDWKNKIKEVEEDINDYYENEEENNKDYDNIIYDFTNTTHFKS